MGGTEEGVWGGGGGGVLGVMGLVLVLGLGWRE